MGASSLKIIRELIQVSILSILLAVGTESFGDSGHQQVQYTPVHTEILISNHQTREALIKIPKNLQPGQKVPVILVFGGFESAHQVLELVHPKIPVALASFDYPYDGARRIQFPEALGSIFEAKRIFPQTLQGISQLVKILKERPEIDSSNLIIVGASFGSFFAIAAASKIPDLRRIILVHGFGRPRETIEHVILKSWYPKYGWVSRPLAWAIAHLAWQFFGLQSPEEYSKSLRPSQKVLLITADHDSFIPSLSSDSLWRAIESSPAQSNRILMKSDHLMPGSNRLIEDILIKIQEWISSGSKFAKSGDPRMYATPHKF